MTEDTSTHVAIVGMACRFPGADSPDAFWANLVAGRDTITRFAPRAVPGSSETFTPARGLITDPDRFDAASFGYSPREARLIAPQQRVMLECGVDALANAGFDPARYPGTIGVYAGGTETAYAQLLKANRDRLPAVTDWEILIANGADFLVPRIAYKLGLRGPAVTVQAACATALVAVHLAVQSLLAGECDLALAGGAAVHAPMKESYYTVGGILSADGYCRTFSAAAGGTVGSDGVGLVVLQRLTDAVADGATIHAVIRGSAVNNDGSDRIGFTAPSVDGQARVIRDAQLVAGVDASTIGYVEAHGTATPLGDPIEVAALTSAFRQDTDATGFCAIGSVKSNIGHTDAAAGIAGLIKTALALRHATIPPSLHIDEPNPKIDFATSPFRPATTAQAWPAGPAPRRAGVSAFGIGGTNAHVVLEEPPRSAAPAAVPGYELLLVSGRTPSARDALARSIAEHLRDHPEVGLADTAFTLRVGRVEQPHRRFVVTAHRDIAIDALASPATGAGPTDDAGPSEDPVAAELIALGRAWCAGGRVDPPMRGERRRVPLPTAPFERERYLVDSPHEIARCAHDSAGSPDDAPAHESDQPAVQAAAQSSPSGCSTVDIVAEAFADLLELPTVGVGESFFDLGGDSLIAVNLINDLAARFAVPLDMMAVYDAPSPSDLAAVVDGLRTAIPGEQ